MRKIITALVLGLALTFSACSGETESKPAEPVTVTAEPSTPEITEVAPEPPTTSAPPTTPVEPPSSDDAIFLQVLRDGTNSWDSVPDADVIELAQLMCGAWDNGASFEEIAQVLLDSGYSQNEAGYFIGAGTETYCPEHSGNFS